MEFLSNQSDSCANGKISKKLIKQILMPESEFLKKVDSNYLEN